MVLCDQFCGTSVHFVNGSPYNDRNNKPHVCSQAQRAREFEGYFNMIQIKHVRIQLDGLRNQFKDTKDIIGSQLNELESGLNGLTNLLDWQENQNKPLAEAFIKRKQKGRDRNKPTSTELKTPTATTKPVIRVASEMLSK